MYTSYGPVTYGELKNVVDHSRKKNALALRRLPQAGRKEEAVVEKLGRCLGKNTKNRSPQSTMTNFKLKVVALVGRGNESQLYLACHRIYPNKSYLAYLLILDVLDFGSRCLRQGRLKAACGGA